MGWEDAPNCRTLRRAPTALFSHTLKCKHKSERRESERKNRAKIDAFNEHVTFLRLV